MPSEARINAEELAAKWRAKVAADPELAKLSLVPDEREQFDGECQPTDGTELAPDK